MGENLGFLRILEFLKSRIPKPVSLRGSKATEAISMKIPDLPYVILGLELRISALGILEFPSFLPLLRSPKDSAS